MTLIMAKGGGGDERRRGKVECKKRKMRGRGGSKE